MTPSDQPGLRPNRACRNCVQIKAKCVPLQDPGLSVCQRCHRLGKECTTPASIPRKRTRHVPPTKVAQPQERVDNVAQMLEARRDYQQPRVDVHVHTPVSLGTETCSPATTSEFSRNPEPANLNVAEYYPKGRAQSAGTVFDISPEIGHSFIAPLHKELFEQFRTHMSKHFPFVTIPSAITTSEMMKDRPFLYTCCVMTAAHRDPPLQARIARDILKYLSEHMLLAGEKSLDLLQGLLIMTAWYHIYTHSNPQIMNFLHLAKALVVDLGINRPPGTGTFLVKLSTEAQEMIHGNGPIVPRHELEELRACLGLYHIHTRFSSIYRRLDPMIWTDHMDDCCESLQRAIGHYYDSHAVALVQLDHILERYVGVNGVQPGTSMPIQTYFRLFTDDLQRYKSSLPTSLQTNDLIIADLHTVELCLYEPIISAPANNAAHRVEAFHSWLRSIVAYFDHFTAQSVDEFPHIPFLSWITVAHTFDVLARLSFMTVEGWDLAYVRTTPGFVQVTNRVIEKLEDVHKHEEQKYPGCRTIRFKIFIDRLEKFKQWYGAKIEAESRNKQQITLAHDEAGADIGYLPAGGELGFAANELSDLLWQDLMVDWPRIDSDFMNSMV